jgi:hypothetical protein
MADNKDTFVYKTFKKRNNQLVKIALFLFAFIIIVWWFLMFFKNKDNAFTFTVIGLIAIVLIINIDKIISRGFNRLDRTWGKGAKAEFAIMEDLEKIQGCKIINDFQMDRGNIDHICISPTGIFTIETKAAYGIISYRDGKLKRNGKEFEKDFLRQVRGESFFLDKLIKERLKKDYYIVPILVFANARIDTGTIFHPIEKVWVCRRGFECKVIENSRDHLNNEEINEVYSLLLGIKNS